MSKPIAMAWSLIGATLILVASSSSANANSRPAGLQLDGGSWRGQVGLSDSFGQANQALASPAAQTPGVYTVARVRGVDGLPTSALHGLAFSVANNLPGGIEPCWLVGYVDPNGVAHELHLMAGNSDQSRASEGGIGASGLGYTRYTFSANIPVGAVTGLSLDAHVLAPLDAPTQVLFDNLTIGSQTVTFAGDARG